VVVFPDEVLSKRDELHAEMVMYDKELDKAKHHLAYLRKMAHVGAGDGLIGLTSPISTVLCPLHVNRLGPAG
jgi:hypothetical protein